MHNWLTTPLEYIIRDYIGFMSEKEHAQTNYCSNKQPPLLSNSISLFEFEAVSIIRPGRSRLLEFEKR